MHLVFSRKWYMNVTDASTNGGDVDLIFNLSDLGLSGEDVLLFYSADGISSWVFSRNKKFFRRYLYF